MLITVGITLNTLLITAAIAVWLCRMITDVLVLWVNIAVVVYTGAFSIGYLFYKYFSMKYLFLLKWSIILFP